MSDQLKAGHVKRSDNVTATFTPIDQAARDRIQHSLGETMFVEAGAGTGKTTSMVGRVVNLIGAGVTTVDKVAAITFTNAAASELRERIREELEKAASDQLEARHQHKDGQDGHQLEAGHVEAADPVWRQLCAQGVEDIDRATFTTLHSFAGAILRERPLEAGLPPSFETMDAVASDLDFDEKWNEWLDWALDDAANVSTLPVALSLGLSPNHLRQIALKFHSNYDLLEGVEFGDAQTVTFGSVRKVVDCAEELGRLCGFSKLREDDRLYQHVQSKLSSIRRLGEMVHPHPSPLPEGEGARRLGEMVHPQRGQAQGPPLHPRDLSRIEYGAGPEGEGAMERGLPAALGMLSRIMPLRTNLGRQGDWNTDPVSGVNACKMLKEYLREVHDEVGLELEQARNVSLAPILGALRDFVVGYERDRKREGRAGYHDLLVWARNLLRDNIDVRDHFRQRYSHILLDEVQDTDPIQMQIAMFLAEDVPEGTPPESRPTDWRKVTPADGRLFVVGDPKQSIYRFRRADVRQLNVLRGQMNRTPVHLDQNFRSHSPIIEWVNHLFGGWMGESESQAEYVGLRHRWEAPFSRSENIGVRSERGGDQASFAPSVWRLGDAYDARMDEIRAIERQGIADAIGRIIDDGWLVRQIKSGHVKDARLNLDIQSDSSKSDVQNDSLNLDMQGDSSNLDMQSDSSKPDMQSDRSKLDMQNASSKTDVQSASSNLDMQSAPGYRPAGYSDICILMPTRTGLRDLEVALDDADVPYRLEGSSLIFDTQEVRDLLNCLRAIDDPGDEVAIVAALRSPAFACTDVELLRHYESGGRFGYLASSSGRDTARSGAGDDHVVEGLDALREYHERRMWTSVAALIDGFVRERPLMTAAVDHPRRREQWRRYRFIVAQARAFAEAGGGSLRSFLEWIDRQRSEGARVTETPVPETDEDAVRIMTVHGAKGLEFPVVILTGLNTQRRSSGEPALFDRAGGAVEVRVGSRGQEFQTPGYETLGADEKAMLDDEHVRLLYVATTRAMDHLVLSLYRSSKSDQLKAGHVSKSDASYIAGRFEGRDDMWRQLPEMTVDSRVRGSDGTATPEKSPSPQPSPSRERGQVGSAPGTPQPSPSRERGHGSGAVEARARWIEARDELIERQGRPSTVAATRLAEVAKEEIKAEQESDEPWRRGRAGTSIGRAVHAVLQTVDLATGDGIEETARAQAAAEGIPGRVDDIVRLSWGAVRSAVVKRAVESGRYWREVPVGVPIGDGSLQGFIDLLFETPDGLAIVDYKTDSVSAEGVSAAAARYRPQAGGYALAIQRATGRRVAEVVFLFLEPHSEESMKGIEELSAEAESLARAYLEEPVRVTDG